MDGGQAGSLSAVDEGQGRIGGRGMQDVWDVTLVETIHHEVRVIASSYEEACAKALDAVTEHEDPVADGVALDFGTYSESDMRVVDAVFLI